MEPFLFVGNTLWSLWQIGPYIRFLIFNQQQFKKQKHSNANWLFGPSKNMFIISIKNWMRPYHRTPKEVATAIGYSGLGVRSVGPVGDVVGLLSFHPSQRVAVIERIEGLWRRFLWMFSWCSPSHGVQMWQPLFCCPSQTLLNLKRTTQKHRNKITNLNYLIFIYLNRQV